MHKTKLIGTQN